MHFLLNFCKVSNFPKVQVDANNDFFTSVVSLAIIIMTNTRCLDFAIVIRFLIFLSCSVRRLFYHLLFLIFPERIRPFCHGHGNSTGAYYWITLEQKVSEQWDISERFCKSSKCARGQCKPIIAAGDENACAVRKKVSSRPTTLRRLASCYSA